MCVCVNPCCLTDDKVLCFNWFLLDLFFPLAVRKGWAKAPHGMAHASQRDKREERVNVIPFLSLILLATGSGVTSGDLVVPLSIPRALRFVVKVASLGVRLNTCARALLVVLKFSLRGLPSFFPF